MHISAQKLKECRYIGTYKRSYVSVNIMGSFIYIVLAMNLDDTGKRKNCYRADILSS